MNSAYLITGGNVGQRQEQLAYAASLIEERCGTIIDQSSIYETAAWGKTDQSSFLNQAIVLETSLNARDLLTEILYIENLMGRDRIEKYGPRIIDIDIIFFNHQVIRESGLVIPHPEMAGRRFVLEPLNEVIPAYIHPVYYKTVNELLMLCKDALPVKKIT
ncbi:MAG TPA: 2-amino-4-hydroxy-6-hydroxymethyldihydropteridine diphosphokinase [Flavitalea sp.]|nr:2-amino-4-hydroxy-6-hydroxymethyldihydropteridine diphosphokinase [Flavitalea sp.]